MISLFLFHNWHLFNCLKYLFVGVKHYFQDKLISVAKEKYHSFDF